MKNIFLGIGIFLLLPFVSQSQTNTIVNYDFNSVSSYPLPPKSTATGITCSATSSEPFQTFTGVVTSSLAFVQNTPAGNAIAMSNSSGNNTRYFLFQLGGSELNTYQSYKLYMQPQRSTTGATLITVAYSTDGSNYTNISTTYTVPTSFSDVIVDLSFITAINNTSSVYIKLMVSGTNASAGTIRIDNVQIQATKGSTNNGGGNNPWQVNGNDVGFVGKVGIGTNNPLFPLDIQGDARVSNNLYVGGGVVISDKVSAITEVKGWNFKVENDIDVESSTRLRGLTRIDQGFTFDGNTGIGYVPNNLGGYTFKMGKQSPLIPLNTFCAAAPYSGVNYYSMDGWLQLYNSSDVNNSALLNMQAWTNGQSSIDASVAGTNGGRLLLNYFCGSNTYINTGQNGGNVIMGKRVDIGGEFSNNTALNINGAQDYGGLFSKTNHTSDYAYNSIFNVNRSLTKAIAVHFNNGNTAEEKFVLWGNGKTEINAVTKTDKYFVINDVSNSNSPVEAFAVTGNGYTKIQIADPTAQENVFDIVDLSANTTNFRVKSNGHVYAREVEILNTSLAFPDYVFKKDYKLMSYENLRQFIKTKEHLPGFEKGTHYEKNGFNVSELVYKQQEKIEELTLYILDMEKRLKEMEDRNKQENSNGKK